MSHDQLYNDIVIQLLLLLLLLHGVVVIIVIRIMMIVITPDGACCGMVPDIVVIMWTLIACGCRCWRGNCSVLARQSGADCFDGTSVVTPLQVRKSRLMMQQASGTTRILPW